MGSSQFQTNGRRVLLIGWDAADWKVITPLIERGKMPHLLELVERGVKGNIATLHPALSPMLWTSIATGKRPHKHGIYGFYEPTPDGMAVQPISNLSRKTKAIWNILNQCGLRSNVVGWWPSHPAEPINGVMVSDLYHKNTIQSGLPKQVPSGSIYPETKLDELSELRFDLNELYVEDMLNFIPLAKEIEQQNDKRLVTCAKVVAECTTVHSAATHLMETSPWDFMAVYYDAIDHFSHSFMRFHPPRRDFIPQRDFDLFKDVVTAAYIYHDMMLGRLVQLAGPETTIVLVSDHGFHPDHLRPTFIPLEPAGPAIEHRDLGIFVMAGPGVVQDELVFGSSLLDITPTILAHVGLPVGQDMDGRVIHEVFQDIVDVPTIPSWDDVPGADGRHPVGMEMNPLETKAYLQQLVDLGYINELSPDRQENVDNAIAELNFNLARSFMDANRFGDALPLLQKLYEDDPDEHRLGIQLASCYKSLGLIDELQDLVERLTERRVLAASDGRKKLVQFERLIKERRSKLKELHADYDDSDDVPKQKVIEEVFSEEERFQYLKCRSLAAVRTSYLDFLRGYVLCSKGQNEQALVFLKRAIDAEPNRPALYIQTGEALLNIGRLEDAKSCFQQAQRIDESNASAMLGMGRYHLQTKAYRMAVQNGLNAVAITYFNPLAHYLIGLGLFHLGQAERALNALQNAVGQNPNFAEAYQWMARIYAEHLDDQRTADHYRGLAIETKQFVEQQRKELGIPSTKKSPMQGTMDPAADSSVAAISPVGLPGVRARRNQKVQTKAADLDPAKSVIVVTGLPRSGTSLMMQMLRAGGVSVWEDAERPPDQDNPNGYVELANARDILTDNSWVLVATGKAIKVVAPLLEGLPAKLDYKVILMVRNLHEIMASQEKMLERNQKSGAGLDADRLHGVLQYQFETAARLLNDKGLATLRVPYTTVIDRPTDVAQRVCEFLGQSMDVTAMASQVDPNLYRNRVKNESDETSLP